MIIAIPSYKRPQDCMTAEYLPSATIFVHEFEVEEYKKYNPNPIIAIPDSLQKTGMATIRNFILDNTPDDEVIMIDDDIRSFGYYEKGEQIFINEEKFLRFAENAFEMTKELGSILWGVNLNNDRKVYREYSPFSLSSVILGPCMGIIKDKDIRFDEKLGLKEDYDYSLQVLNKYRKILRFNKFHYVAAHMTKKGGCATYRTTDKELSQAQAFQRKWGSRIVQIQRKLSSGRQSINPVVRVPISGI